ncbi:MAG: hypothetical protein ACREBU_10750, partial [Nitrososphaera sp.]
MHFQIPVFPQTSLNGWGSSGTSEGLALVALDETTGALDAYGFLSGMTSNGFTLGWTDAPADADRVYYLALKGGKYHVGNFQKTTNGAPATQSVTGVPFKPIGLVMTSINNAPS